ncbi:thioesterase domain-containing protein [Streptomyces sp. NPDC051219]|uniref:thioesterase II family protein n=1 Tax=Streptomyces sp. NPDC051219 TaxID=3155283 RepID=UPI0034425CD9
MTVTVTAPSATPTACLVRTPREDAPLRLFCFHHAGGGASFFAPWHGRVVPEVDVVPVQLPGRESRFRERRFHDVRTLAEALDRELAPWLDRPYAVYGHSMGALVAFTLVTARIRAGGRAPHTLFVGAYAAPHLTPALPSADGYADDELARFLVDIGGLSPQFLGRPDWLRAMLPVVRDDLRICASHDRAGLPDPADPEVRLPLDVQAFAGADDQLVAADGVRAWERYARRFEMTTVPGGHFFPREAPDAFFDVLNRSLTGLIRGPGGRRGERG